MSMIEPPFKVNNANSNMRTVKCGVPQGSVLGPLLFIIYINDLANSCNDGLFRIFADDTGIFCVSNNLESLMTKAEGIMKQVNAWFIANKLTLNISKTSFIIFRSKGNKIKNIPNSINCEDIIIHRESQVKYLGLILDEHMRWDSHINEICNKLKCFFPLFYNIRHYLDMEHIRAIYFTMIYSRLKYGCIVTGQTYIHNINKIQTLQNRLLKVLSHKPYRYPTNKLHNELSILKFTDMIKQETLSFVYQYIHGKLPIVFDKYFIHRHKSTEIIAEQRKRRFTPPIHYNFIGACTVKVVGSQLLNKHASKLKLNNSIKTFRANVKQMYLPYAES